MQQVEKVIMLCFVRCMLVSIGAYTKTNGIRGRVGRFSLDSV